MSIAIQGYIGECTDPLNATYRLGNGYRAYNPRLMRLHCPDSWSPFGSGGLNVYTCCAGDPVNRADPFGHHSAEGWLGIGVGLVLGLLLTPLSGGRVAGPSAVSPVGGGRHCVIRSGGCTAVFGGIQPGNCIQTGMGGLGHRNSQRAKLSRAFPGCARGVITG